MISTETSPYLCVSLRGARFGFDARQVVEVRRAWPLTPIPGTPPFLLGVGYFQGRVIPAIDISIRLGLGESTQTRALIVEVDEALHALFVDTVDGIVELPRPRGGLALTFARSLSSVLRDVVSTGPDEPPITLVNLEPLVRYTPDTPTLPFHSPRAPLPPQPLEFPSRVEVEERVIFAVLDLTSGRVALPSEQLVEITAWCPPTPFNKPTPAYILGHIQHRGARIPVLDLARRLGEPEDDGAPEAPRVLAITRLAGRLLALSLNGVGGLRAIPSRDIRPAPPILRARAPDCIERLIFLPERVALTVIEMDALVPPTLRHTIRSPEESVMIPSITSKDDRDFALFSFGGDTFALPIHEVREALPRPSITRIPGAPDHVAGVMWLRDDVIPVVTPNAGASSAESRTILLIEHRATLHALLIDRLIGIQRASSFTFTTPEKAREMRPLRAATLLDLDALLDPLGAVSSSKREAS